MESQKFCGLYSPAMSIREGLCIQQSPGTCVHIAMACHAGMNIHYLDGRNVYMLLVPQCIRAVRRLLQSSGSLMVGKHYIVDPEKVMLGSGGC
jgi:hypothetical protein